MPRYYSKVFGTNLGNLFEVSTCCCIRIQTRTTMYTVHTSAARGPASETPGPYLHPCPCSGWGSGPVQNWIGIDIVFQRVTSKKEKWAHTRSTWATWGGSKLPVMQMMRASHELRSPKSKSRDSRDFKGQTKSENSTGSPTKNASVCCDRLPSPETAAA